MLSDGQIRKLVEQRELGLEPFNTDQLQPASYDVCLDSTLLIPVDPAATIGLGVNQGPVWPYQPRDNEPPRFLYLDMNLGWPTMRLAGPYSKDPGPHYLVRPGQFVLGSTIEHFSLPDFLGARLEGKSTLGRSGLTVHVTAGFIDPGFTGNITVELYNVAPWSIAIHPGMRIGQVSFFPMAGRVEKPYRGKYQGQRGTTEPRPTPPAPGLAE